MTKLLSILLVLSFGVTAAEVQVSNSTNVKLSSALDLKKVLIEQEKGTIFGDGLIHNLAKNM